ncbi:M23 family metallopeptidase [Herbiconiux sp. KACC 21604]|uniref:M23 family metallopeptidase n=1 Tax=unclassified Herbiconiux TaxID=2618217 RepID=UPI0014931E54|nr:M23 family metallopeptidase [Herbiconiux sp. SALV-R1]QJU54235.1 M23 family metallopeptidase [Herbiconiux sp. SALV-R1]WPO85297.1 M23 family metallopeptidase [Herbiconiux sp. KACC 21604]
MSSNAPLTRRALREQREREEAERKALARRPRESPRTPRSLPNWKGVAAFSFAALLAAATSLSAIGGPTTSSFAEAPVTTELPASQELLTAAGTELSVTRDEFRATTPEELAAARAAEAARVAAAKAAAFGIRTASTYTNNTLSEIQWPFPVGVPISDGFGPRSSPGGIGSTNHKGVDFTPGQGTPIGAIASGVVSKVVRSDGGGLGVYVVVDHVIDGEEVSSWYGHMLTGSPTVSEGQAVVVGQQLGSVGNTGTSTGAHLHLEIHVGGSPVDPFAWLQAHN